MVTSIGDKSFPNDFFTYTLSGVYSFFSSSSIYGSEGLLSFIGISPNIPVFLAPSTPSTWLSLEIPVICVIAVASRSYT